jgi:acyl-coenzyme A thioesterase PaaI-like protein
MNPMTRSELMALLDDCMLEAVRARWGADRDIEAVDLHIAFMGEPSGPLAASAQVVGGGRTVSFCHGQLLQPNGAVIAQAQATYRAVQRTTPLS